MTRRVWGLKHAEQNPASKNKMFQIRIRVRATIGFGLGLGLGLGLGILGERLGLPTPGSHLAAWVFHVGALHSLATVLFRRALGFSEIPGRK